MFRSVVVKARQFSLALLASLLGEVVAIDALELLRAHGVHTDPEAHHERRELTGVAQYIALRSSRWNWPRKAAKSMDRGRTRASTWADAERRSWTSSSNCSVRWLRHRGPELRARFGEPSG
jgi:hypothetical protein